MGIGYVLSWIIFGAFTGWLASKIIHRRGQGCMVNIALGLVGAMVGGTLFRNLTGFRYEFAGFVTSTIVAVIGAVVVLVIWNAIQGRSSR